MLRMMFAVAIAIALLAVAGGQAEARNRPMAGAIGQVCGNSDVMRPCGAVSAEARRPAVARHALKSDDRSHVAQRSQAIKRASYGRGGEILPHPAGCPARLFCGCGAAVRVFGRPVRELWLAAAWFRFPRAAPAAGMVAVRRHHVFVLEAHLGGDTWLAYDANSGGRATRRHARSIRGYAIVNPQGAA